MTERWRHSTDDLDTVRMNADRLHAQLTDYVPATPSILAKCLYLSEAEKRLELRPEVKRELRELRAVIAQAVGLE